MDFKWTNALWIYAAALGIMLIHFSFFHGGYFGYDELEYCHLAHDLINGNYHHGGNLYAYRYGVVLPLALQNLLWGPGDFANLMFSMLFYLGVLYIMLQMIQESPFWIRLTAAVYFFCLPMVMLYLEKPMPDIVTAFGFLLCYYAYYRQRIVKQNHAVLTNPLLFLLGAILIFISKETFLVLYPFFLFFFVRDMLGARETKFWKTVPLSILAFLALYFAACYLFLGDAFARIHAIFTDRHISACTYELQPFEVVLRRIAYQLWFDFTRSGMMLPLGFLVLLRKKYGLTATEQFHLKSWIALLLLANFMTISYTDYVPLCNDPRHFMFLIPIGAMVFGIGLKYAAQLNTADRLLVLGLFLGQLAVSLYYNYENTWFLYVPVTLAIALQFWVKNKIPVYALAVLSVVSMFVQDARYSKKINHQGQKALLEYTIDYPAENKLVITDAANANIGNFYADYQYDKVYFTSFGDMDTLNLNRFKHKLVVMNGMTRYLSNLSWDDMPDFAKTAEEKLPKVYANKSGEVFLYK